MEQHSVYILLMNPVNLILFNQEKLLFDFNRTQTAEMFCLILQAPESETSHPWSCPAHLLGTLLRDGSDAGLHARRSGIGGVSHPSPRGDGPGCLPAGRSHRRVGERDPVKHIRLVQRQALDGPVFDEQFGPSRSVLVRDEGLI